MNIEFETENSAFDNDNTGAEISRILEEIAEQVRSGQDSGVIMDINGNKIGKWSL